MHHVSCVNMPIDKTLLRLPGRSFVGGIHTTTPAKLHAYIYPQPRCTLQQEALTSGVTRDVLEFADGRIQERIADR